MGNTAVGSSGHTSAILSIPSTLKLYCFTPTLVSHFVFQFMGHCLGGLNMVVKVCLITCGSAVEAIGYFQYKCISPGRKD